MSFFSLTLRKLRSNRTWTIFSLFQKVFLNPWKSYKKMRMKRRRDFFRGVSQVLKVLSSVQLVLVLCFPFSCRIIIQINLWFRFVRDKVRSLETKTRKKANIHKGDVSAHSTVVNGINAQLEIASLAWDRTEMEMYVFCNLLFQLIFVSDSSRYKTKIS